MTKAKGSRTNDNGDFYVRKVDWLSRLWIPLTIIIISGGSFFGFSLTKDNSMAIENKHCIEMLEQNTNIEIKYIKEQLTRIESHVEKIADGLAEK